MINRPGNITVTAILLSFNYLSTAAQGNIPRYEIGVNLSSFVYQGDLTPFRFGSFKTMRWGINIYGSKILGPSFSLRTNLAFGGLKGDDAKYSSPEYRKQRNFNFRSPVLELSELLVWNPLHSNYEDKGLSPYLFAGAGISAVHIKRDWSKINANYFGDGAEIWTGLAIDSAHTPSRLVPVIPAGAGLRYAISPRWTINAETSYRFGFTDYLDGFSKAVNPSKNDHYMTYAVGLVYRKGKKNRLNCPVIRY